VTSLDAFFDTELKAERVDWEKSLLAELKLSEVNQKDSHEMFHDLRWPTLSLQSHAQIQISSTSPWKKASTTYAQLAEDEIELFLSEDLKSGVRNFFFYDQALSESKWKRVEEVLKKCPIPSEIEVFLLGQQKYQSHFFKVIQCLLTGHEAHDQGGYSFHELGFLAKKIIQSDDKEIYLGVFVDSQFFHNIAKLRAARIMAEKILQDLGRKITLKVVALTSFQGWTLFERYSNMLRNETAVASGYIGGADHVQSCGYNTLIELESVGPVGGDHRSCSQRMARNTTHILALESMLGVVEDAAFGSYHLDNLTEALCEKSWGFMQKLLRQEDVSSEISNVQLKKLKMIKTRKLIMSGINDFPDVEEVLNIQLLRPFIFRPARVFEDLRLRMEKIKKRSVYIALFGDYSALNLRVSFIKNYFELLGIKVISPRESERDLSQFIVHLEQRVEDVVVLCASDADYAIVSKAEFIIQSSHRYLAGKFEMDTFTNLFSGQNIYEILEHLVNEFEAEK
jgi:hypothetical protein